ncbi:MAG TPA: SBBP repeat-containing protein [bacterium]|nr:SBBP repeat-containing protein [bacterium]
MKKTLGILGMFLLVMTACDDNATSKPMGSVGGPCYGNGTCDDGLQCVLDICEEITDSENTDESTEGLTDLDKQDDSSDVDTVPVPCSTENEVRYLACGFNGNGLQKQKCAAGYWENDGSCDDPDECANDSTQVIACGFNGNGTLNQLCLAGGWADNGNCNDPDVCKNETWESIDGNTSECVLGQWILRRITKMWGTSEAESGNSVAVSSLGDIYVTGYTDGSFDGNASAGNEDIFLTRWNPDLTKAWTKQWGTSSGDEGKSVAVDTSGNIFVTGVTDGNLDGNTSAGTGDNADIFLTKWNPDGTKAWTKQWGTKYNSEVGNAVAVDASGNIFVAGNTSGLGGLDGNSSLGGSTDIFLTKWNADGTKAWTKQWGTDVNEWGSSVSVDNTGNIFVVGFTQGSLDGNTNIGNADIFLTKWNLDGTKAWTKQWGSDAEDLGQAVAVDFEGSVYVAGRTRGGLDGNSYSGINLDAFLSKFDVDGSKAWTRQWETPTDYQGAAVAIDTSGNIVVTGFNQSLVKYAADGTNVWTKKWGTAPSNSVAVDLMGNMFLVGLTDNGLDGCATYGNYDTYLSKWLAE